MADVSDKPDAPISKALSSERRFLSTELPRSHSCDTHMTAHAKYRHGNEQAVVGGAEGESHDLTTLHTAL